MESKTGRGKRKGEDDKRHRVPEAKHVNQSRERWQGASRPRSEARRIINVPGRIAVVEAHQVVRRAVAARLPPAGPVAVGEVMVALGTARAAGRGRRGAVTVEAAGARGARAVAAPDSEGGGGGVRRGEAGVGAAVVARGG